MTDFSRLMFLSFTLVVTALASGPTGAQAQPYGPNERQAARERFQPLSPQEQERSRERMRDRGESGGRDLSPDERRQLRRDIFEHGREVYRERPGPGDGRQPRR